MDQLKEYLRLAIKYRFWIAVGLSALLPAIAYAIGSGPIQQKAAERTAAIKQADSAVKRFMMPGIPNVHYKRQVNEKKRELTKDVYKSWKKLHARQAPLQTWPKSVEERFRAWGRKWPENVDASAVQVAIIDYVTAYPRYVSDIYRSFHPFDPVEGTGIVAAPPEATLLKPAPFTIESPPELGKVWAVQERLWVQRALLQVIADVNKDAKDWDAALIKQINNLEVGNPAAQDQISISKGLALEEARPLYPPGFTPPAPTQTPGSPTPGIPGAGMQNTNPDVVYSIKTEGHQSNQFKILPIRMSVLIDQAHIQDLLVALESSPMAIQVIDFEMAKPGARVVKPLKGETRNFAGESGDSMSQAYYNIGSARMRAFGGMNTGMREGAYAHNSNSSMTGPGAAIPSRTGVDQRGVDRAAKRKVELEQATGKKAKVSIHDPYYEIVEVTLYGQARIYYPPPPQEGSPEPSQAPGTPAPAPTPTRVAPPLAPPGG
ncbi:MAG: hypothetical protein JO329_22435 [Planctomycetaceae bacterium]|nr:hypothetical protein [Planctomycetaceae bacterium]